jgi:hypothetical protein
MFKKPANGDKSSNLQVFTEGGVRYLCGETAVGMQSSKRQNDNSKISKFSMGN